MNIRYRVELSQAERDELTRMLSKGKSAARKLGAAAANTELKPLCPWRGLSCFLCAVITTMALHKSLHKAECANRKC
jgi:hypothetical protein